ncbi:MAG: quinone-dependent dihydroorotate dehydrogenase [Methylacidiphilales bacterium]|nr:quinone-dependent dihydroorotate dehydrogenase [Candidatus Methylacidiphilales bacterium]
MDFIYPLIRPLLFLLDGEFSHTITIQLLDKCPWLVRKFSFYKPVVVSGVQFKNPIGIAAGLVKNADALIALARMGVGSIEVGTVTPHWQSGNDGPRLERIISDQALVNRMGFNNKGFLIVRERLLAVRKKLQNMNVVIGVNIGKQKSTPIEEAHLDYIEGIRFFKTCADYFVLNISSPNTKDLHLLQYGNRFSDMLSKVTTYWQQIDLLNQAKPPIFIKISPVLSEKEISFIIDCCVSAGINTIIATNTLPTEQGGLSGLPLAQRSKETLTLIKKINPSIQVISSGGIMSSHEGIERFQLGASIIQLYSGLIYQGPGLIRNIAKLLDK